MANVACNEATLVSRRKHGVLQQPIWQTSLLFYTDLHHGHKEIVVSGDVHWKYFDRDRKWQRELLAVLMTHSSPWTRRCIPASSLRRHTQEFQELQCQQLEMRPTSRFSCQLHSAHRWRTFSNTVETSQIIRMADGLHTPVKALFKCLLQLTEWTQPVRRDKKPTRSLVGRTLGRGWIFPVLA